MQKTTVLQHDCNGHNALAVIMYMDVCLGGEHLFGVEGVNLFNVSPIDFDIRHILICKNDFTVARYEPLGKLLTHTPSSKDHIDCTNTAPV